MQTEKGFELRKWSLPIAYIVTIIGALFIGISIGTVTTRSDAIVEKQQLITSYNQTIQAKDQLIETLSATTIKATGAAIERSEKTVLEALTEVDASTEKATKAQQEAAKAKARVEEQARLQRLNQRKLSELK